MESIVFLSTNQKNFTNQFSQRSLFGDHTADKETRSENDPELKIDAERAGIECEISLKNKENLSQSELILMFCISYNA